MRKSLLILLIVVLVAGAGFYLWQQSQSSDISTSTVKKATPVKIPAPPARSNPLTDEAGNILSTPLNAYDN